MRSKKKSPTWPAEYEPPKVFSIETAFQQALGVTYCSLGTDASGGTGSCSPGSSADGTPTDPNACAPGAGAMTGPGHGSSPCGPGFSAEA